MQESRRAGTCSRPTHLSFSPLVLKSLSPCFAADYTRMKYVCWLYFWPLRIFLATEGTENTEENVCVSRDVSGHRTQYGRRREAGIFIFNSQPATRNSPMKLTKLELILLGVNLFVLGGLVVLMALRGPTTASVLLLVGTVGMAIGKIGRAWVAKQG
jgi:hypothetical protein